MIARSLTASILALATIIVAASAVMAQEQPIKRTELMRVPVEGLESKESVIYTADFAPGAAAPRHSHPGQEFIYIIEGSVTLEPDGMPAQTLKAGETTMQPAYHVHAAKNASTSASAKLLVIVLADKDKPLVIPAQ